MGIFYAKSTYILTKRNFIVNYYYTIFATPAYIRRLLMSDTPSITEARKRFRSEIIPSLVLRMSASQSELREGHFAEFQLVVRALAQESYDGIARIAGTPAADAEPLFRVFALADAISAINGTLPPDHPFIVALVAIKSDSAVAISGLPRMLIPNLNIVDMCAIAPVIHVSDIYAWANGVFERTSLVSLDDTTPPPLLLN